MFAVSITTKEKVTIRLKPTDTDGDPATLDGAPKWSSISGSATVVAAPDGLSAELIAGDLPGDTVFLVDGDADLGEGVEDIQETITLHVEGVRAANLGISADAPVKK